MVNCYSENLASSSNYYCVYNTDRGAAQKKELQVAEKRFSVAIVRNVWAKKRKIGTIRRDISTKNQE